jgi:hypothetical protein
MWTVRQSLSQRDTPMLSGRTLHDRSRVRWLDQNRDPARDRAWARSVSQNRDPARGSAWRRGVAHNRDPARDRAWARGVAQNRDPARATRIAEISTLRLYCPLLNNNAPLPVAVEANPPATLWLVGHKKPTRYELAGFRTRLLYSQDPGIAALIVARLFQSSSEAAVPSSWGRGFLFISRPCTISAGLVRVGDGELV